MKETTVKQKTLIEKGMLLRVNKGDEVISGVVIDLYKHKSWLQLTILDGEGILHKCSYSLWDGSFRWQDNTINVLAAMTFIKDSNKEKKIDMEATQLPIKKVKCTHSGPYHAYGDSFTVWQITLEDNADVTREDMLTYCFTQLSKRKVQSKQEWSANHRDTDKYFSGYYELTRTGQTYTYTVCSPYTD